MKTIKKCALAFSISMLIPAAGVASEQSTNNNQEVVVTKKLDNNQQTNSNNQVEFSFQKPSKAEQGNTLTAKKIAIKALWWTWGKVCQLANLLLATCIVLLLIDYFEVQFRTQRP